MKKITFEFIKNWKVDLEKFDEIYKKEVCIDGILSKNTKALKNDFPDIKDAPSFLLNSLDPDEEAQTIFIGNSVESLVDIDKTPLKVRVRGEFGALPMSQNSIGKISSVEILSLEP